MPARARPEVPAGIAVHGLFVTFGLVIASLFPFFAIYLRDKGLSADQIGLVLAAMAVMRTFLLPAWGHIADTSIGRLTALQIGAAGAGVAAVVLAFAEGFGAITLAACLLSAFMIATGPNVDAIALEHLGKDRMADYGHIRAWESLSYAAGCLVFGVVLEVAGVGWEMTLFALSAFSVLAWSATIRRDRPTETVSHGRLGAVGAVFRAAPRFWGFLAATLLVWTAFNAAWNFISLRISDEGGGPLLIGLGTALGGLIEVPVMRVSSRLQRRFGLRKVYALGCLIYAGAFLAWGLVSDPAILSFLTVFEGAAFALLFTTGVVVVGRLLPSSLYSTGGSVAAMVGFGIGPILGAGIGGFVFERLGPVTLYAGASVLAISAAGVSWIALSTPALADPEAETEPVL